MTEKVGISIQIGIYIDLYWEYIYVCLMDTYFDTTYFDTPKHHTPEISFGVI